MRKGPRDSQTPHLTIIHGWGITTMGGDCGNPILKLYCYPSRCYAVALTGVAASGRGLQIEVWRLTFTRVIIWYLGMAVAHGLCVSTGVRVRDVQSCISLEIGCREQTLFELQLQCRGNRCRRFDQ